MDKLASALMICLVLGATGFSTSKQEEQSKDKYQSLDRQVRQFMESRRGSWRDLNVPEVDGKALYDIVLQHGYKNALEIGTSTGYSGIWISWALAKTGGKLVTIELDKYRYDEAVANFRAAGLSNYVDARLGNAHDLVPALKGPFDFVFCDADKDWYVNYLKAALPKISKGGCFAAHNVSENSGGRGGRDWGGGFMRGSRGEGGDYLEFARSISSLETKVLDLPGSNGLAVSYKKAEN
jgi:caffeoyl-CoA O-methyltransferase